MSLDLLIEELLERTPIPEHGEPAKVLERAQEVMADRQDVLTQIVAAAAAGEAPSAAARETLAEVERRQQHWDGVLRAARGKTGLRLDALKRQQREKPRGTALGYQVA